MFKDIKVKNSKINIVTLIVIVVFMAYFLTSFAINMKYIQQIKNDTDVSNML